MRAEKEAQSLRSHNAELESRLLELEEDKKRLEQLKRATENGDDDEFNFVNPFNAIANTLESTLQKSATLLEAVGDATKANTELIKRFTEEGSSARINEGSTSSSSSRAIGEGLSNNSNAKTPTITYTIPKIQSAIQENEKDFAYKREIFEALKEIRILAQADLIRLTHHKDYAEKKFLALGLYPPSLRIKSYNWPIQLPLLSVKKEVDALIERAQNAKLRIFLGHYKKAALERNELIVRISAHITTLTSKSPHLGEKCGDINRRSQSH